MSNEEQFYLEAAPRWDVVQKYKPNFGLFYFVRVWESWRVEGVLWQRLLTYVPLCLLFLPVMFVMDLISLVIMAVYWVFKEKIWPAIEYIVKAVFDTFNRKFVAPLFEAIVKKFFSPISLFIAILFCCFVLYIVVFKGYGSEIVEIIINWIEWLRNLNKSV